MKNNNKRLCYFKLLTCKKKKKRRGEGGVRYLRIVRTSAVVAFLSALREVLQRAVPRSHGPAETLQGAQIHRCVSLCCGWASQRANSPPLPTPRMWPIRVVPRLSPNKRYAGLQMLMRAANVPFVRVPFASPAAPPSVAYGVQAVNSARLSSSHPRQGDGGTGDGGGGTLTPP